VVAKAGDSNLHVTLLAALESYVRLATKPYPRLANDMPSLLQDATDVVNEWSERQKEVILAMSKEILEAPSSREARSNSSVWKRIKGFVNLLLQTHPVIRCFFVPLTDPFSRHHRIITVTSVYIGALCIALWFHAEQSVECCRQAVRFFYCDELPSAGRLQPANATARPLLPLLMQPPRRRALPHAHAVPHAVRRPAAGLQPRGEVRVRRLP